MHKESAELDLVVAVVGGDALPAVTGALAWGPYGAHPCPKTHLALCFFYLVLSHSSVSLFFSFPS